MCGIAVAVDWQDAEAVVRQLTLGILHRGDVTDPLVAPRPNIAMCTRRLRIVDAAGGEQPVASHDGRLKIAFNGEIYNHAALRAELEQSGIKFRTKSDTEVLVNALQVWGATALKRLKGMYAFVVVDTETGEFLAARDPFGVKPLYLIQSGQSFLFCSEMRPLLAAVPDAEVMLLPPGYLLTRNFCRQFYHLPAPASFRAPDRPVRSTRSFRKRCASAFPPICLLPPCSAAASIQPWSRIMHAATGPTCRPISSRAAMRPTTTTPRPMPTPPSSICAKWCSRRRTGKPCPCSKPWRRMSKPSSRPSSAPPFTAI